MISILRLLVVLFVPVVMMAGCSDDEGSTNPTDDNNSNNNNNTETYANTMSATINGETWSATNILVVHSVNLGIRTVTVTGTGPNASNLNISILNVPSTGDYTVDGQTISFSGDFNGISPSATQTRSGTITVTNITDTGIRGTFTLDGANADGDAFTVRNGTFDVPFP